MKIRRASPNDSLGIATVHVESWRFAYKGIVEDSLLSSLNIISRAKSWKVGLEKDSSNTFVAVSSGGLVEGFIHICSYRDADLQNQNFGEISAVYINPKLLGTGVGGLLFQAGLEALSKKGFSKIALWVLEENDIGIAFYKKFCFGHDGGKKVDSSTGLVELRYTN